MIIKNDTDIYDKLFPKGDILTNEEINQLKSSGKTINFNKKDIIFRQGTLTSHVMYLETGLIKLSKDGRNNRSIILKIATPGYFIGLTSIFGDKTFQHTATAIEDSSVFFIDINTFNSVLEKNGKYSVYLLKKVCKNNLNIVDRITSQYQKQLPGKIADIILYFSENIYHSNTFEFPLTRNELAELAGTTKESFIRTLTEFKNDRIIEIDGKFIKIKSIDIIKTLSRIG
ncbi:MAG: Crp/Fnr family transcriptional regulator [Bacteroidales bacterium]|nr:Crp/Fnr family transcriptional regulator [Bacteroidales bacterium]